MRGVDGQPWGAEASGASFRAPLGTAMGVQGQFLLDEEIAAGAFAEGPLGQLQRILSARGLGSGSRCAVGKERRSGVLHSKKKAKSGAWTVVPLLV